MQCYYNIHGHAGEPDKWFKGNVSSLNGNSQVNFVTDSGRHNLSIENPEIGFDGDCLTVSGYVSFYRDVEGWTFKRIAVSIRFRKPKAA